jgi:chromosomal replication initiator protein
MLQLDWDATISTLKETVPQAQFQNWFKPLKLIRCDESSVVLGVPSRFHEEWIRNNYSSAISSAIRKQIPNELQLEFEVLIQKENVEAASAQENILTTPLPIKPTLRLIENKTESPPDIVEEVEKPNIPIFKHSFIESNYNKVAYQCALMLCADGNSINSLVISAGVGMGKTHLLAQVGKWVLLKNQNTRVRYTNAEMFTAEMVYALKNDRIYQFKKKYREDTDVLLFDDVQGLAKRMRTQEELLHIFNELTTQGKRIVFTSQVLPHQLEEFIDPLRSRLLSSVFSEIKFPTFEERFELLKQHCDTQGISLEENVIAALADKGQKDVRELLGTLLRVHLQAKIDNKVIDEVFIATEAASRPQGGVQMSEIIFMVQNNFGITREEILSKSRKSLTVWARQVAMYLARHFTLLPLEEIGKAFGKDHATVIHAFQKVTEIMESQPTRKYEVEYLRQKLENRGSKNDSLPNI